MNELKVKILLNNQDKTAIESSNPVLKKGEPIIVVDGEQTKMKIGDGSSNYNDLPFIYANAADVYEWAKSETKPTYIAGDINFTDGESIQQKFDNGGLRGEKGEPGEPGKVIQQTYVGAEEPVDETVMVWLDTQSQGEISIPSKMSELENDLKVPYSLSANTISVENSAWVSDETFPLYPYRADINLEGLTDKHVCVNLTMDHTNPDLVIKISPYVSTSTGKFSIYSSEQFGSNITVEHVFFLQGVI